MLCVFNLCSIHLDTACFDIALHFKLMCDHIEGVLKLLNIICAPINR